MTRERLELLGSDHVENAGDLFDRISAKISQISASDLVKRLVLLMIKADIDSATYGLDFAEEEIMPYYNELKAEGKVK